MSWGARCLAAFFLLSLLVYGASYLIALAIGQPEAEWPHVAMLGVWLLGVVVGIGGAVVRRIRRKTKPCRHGTKGAFLVPARCAECVAEAQEQEAQRKAEAERQATEEQRRRQREYDEYRARIRLPSYLEQMDAREFELLVCDLFRREGYSAESTPFSGDSGVDGYLRRDGKLLRGAESIGQLVTPPRT